MKILLIANSDFGRKGTIGFRFFKIAENLYQNKVDFEIIARRNYSNFRVQIPFYKNYLARICRAIQIYFFSNFHYRKLEVSLFDQFVLSQLKKTKIDFSLAHFGEYLPRSISYLKKQQVKILLDTPIAHPSYALYLQSKGFILDEKIEHIPNFLKKSIELADLLIVPSFFVKETLEIAGVKKPVEIVPFGTDLPQNFSEKDIKERLVKPLKFIFAGNVNFRKGVNFLLEAWEKANLDDAEFLICGRVYRTIKRILRNFKLKNVKFLGYVNLDDYFRKANVFVFPTLFEGSAKVVYEAMSYGLPIITTFNAGSIVVDGQSGFIIPIGDVDILADKILYFYNNRDKIFEMGTNAFKEVKNYSWKRYGENIFSIYKIMSVKN